MSDRPVNVSDSDSSGGIRAAASIFAAIPVVLRTLSENPLRTVLSTLGIVIGVAALVAVLSLGDTMERFSRQQIEQTTGLQMITVSSRTGERIDGVFVRRDSYPTIAIGDARELEQRLAGSAGVTLMLREGALVTLPGDTTSAAAILTATLANALEFSGQDLVSGRFFSAEEMSANAPVCVISEDLAAELAGGSDAMALLDSQVQVRGQTRRVIGLIAQEEGARRSTVYVPLTSASELFVPQAAPLAPALMVKARSLEQVDEVRERTAAWLAARFGANWEEEFNVELSARRLEQAQRAMLFFRLIMGAITGIAILVGGIGIMNILLASVAERTREIGIRKATGARNRDILFQFLAESIVIAGVGSIIGVVLGLIATFIFISVSVRLSEAPVSMAFNWVTPLVAAGIAIFVGLVFGMYPALRAARLQPVDAIRYE